MYFLHLFDTFACIYDVSGVKMVGPAKLSEIGVTVLHPLKLRIDVIRGSTLVIVVPRTRTYESNVVYTAQKSKHMVVCV